MLLAGFICGKEHLEVGVRCEIQTIGEAPVDIGIRGCSHGQDDLADLGLACRLIHASYSVHNIFSDENANKIAVIKEVRALTGLGLGEAKALVESAPKPIVEKAETDLKKILTAEQSAKLGDLQKNRDLNPDFQRGGRGGPPGNFPNRGGGPGGQGFGGRVHGLQQGNPARPLLPAQPGRFGRGRHRPGGRVP